MKKVKTIFFLTEGEALDKRKELNDSYIVHFHPCYEMEDGTILYPKYGGPAGGEVTYHIRPQ